MDYLWLIVALAVIVIAVAIFKSQDLMFFIVMIKKYLFFIIFIGLVLFFAFSLSHIHKTYDVKLNSSEGIKTAGKVYLSWIGSLFSNIGKVTGYVVNQDWTLNNKTEKTPDDPVQKTRVNNRR